MQGRIVAISVGRRKPISYRGKVVQTGIDKRPIDGPVRVSSTNVDGDEQADPTVHGGFDQAVYAYAREDYAWWEDVLGRDMPAGMFGENLLVSGLDLREALIGERWAVGAGGLVLEVSQPRIPCFKLGNKMGDQRFLKKFAQARRPGTYLRVIQEGTIAAGDTIDVISRPDDHLVSIGLMNDVILFERERRAELLAAPALSDRVREWASG